MNKLSTLFSAVLACAIFAAPTIAQDLPRIAVYVTGDVAENEKKALGTMMLSALVNLGRYRGIERSGAFLAEIDKEQATQRSGSIDDGQISELGKRFGVEYVCIADITPAFGSFQVSGRVVDVETAEVSHIGVAFSPLKTPDDLKQVSVEVVRNMFKMQASASKPKVAPAPEPPRAVARPAQPPPVAPPPARTTENVIDDGRQRVEAIPPAPSAPSKPASFWAAVGLDVLGAGLIAYGIAEDGNVGKDYNSKAGYDKVKSSEKSRNIAYTIGAAALIGGVTIHIFF